jgi:sugar phosphate isomerase/epimerase
MKKEKLPFRLGTTSYIIPDDILPNVRFLANLVDDIELVLFEVDDGPNNLPDQKTINELNRLAQQNHISYTVHLPLDLRLAGNDGEQHISLKKAQKVINCTRELNPFAYVLHLDGRELLQQSDPESLIKWNQQAFLALQQVSSWTENPQLLTVENLEHYPIDLWDEVIKRASVSRCIDIGHLWVDKKDPVTFLKDRLNETRVLHIHGIGERDHQSLENVANDELNRVLNTVLQSAFRGVMTIEVFNEDDFRSSITAIHKVLEKQISED